MRLRLERTTRFPRDAVFAWWTDFREDDHLRPGSPVASVREIVRKRADELWIRDRAVRPIRIAIVEHVTLDPPGGYRVRAQYPGADIEYAYRFEPRAHGAGVVLEVDIRPRGLGRILVPLTAWLWRRYAARDLDFHLREMDRDLRRV